MHSVAQCVTPCDINNYMNNTEKRVYMRNSKPACTNKILHEINEASQCCHRYTCSDVFIPVNIWEKILKSCTYNI